MSLNSFVLLDSERTEHHTILLCATFRDSEPEYLGFSVSVEEFGCLVSGCGDFKRKHEAVAEFWDTVKTYRWISDNHDRLNFDEDEWEISRGRKPLPRVESWSEGISRNGGLW